MWIGIASGAFVLRAGLILPLRDMWLGGANYFHNLLRCYQQHPAPGITLVVFTDRTEELARFKSDAIEVHPWPTISTRTLHNFPRRAARRWLGYDPGLPRILDKNRINLLSHNNLEGQTRINT